MPLKRLAYPILIALGIVLIFWKITLSGQFTWMDGVDTAQQVLPWLQLQAREWHQGRFPLFDPYHWAGQSLIGQTQPGVVYPLNWLLFALPMTHGRLQTPILNGYFVFIHMMGAWAMFALLRMLRTVRPIAAIIAIVFGGGGYMATVEWPQMLNGAVWLPVAVLFWLRFLRSPGRPLLAATAGAAGGIAVLSGHHSGPIMILLLVTGITAYGLFTKRRTRQRLLCYSRGFAVFGAFFFLLSAVQALPATEYWRVAYRFVNTKEPVTFEQQIPYTVHRHFSLDAASLPGLVFNGFHREAALNPFLGVTLVALAAIGFLAFRRSSTARLFLFLAVFSLFLAMGENSILHGLFYARFPLFDKLRNPSMIVLGVHFALLVLAAMGLEAIRTGRAGGGWGRGLLLLGGAGFAGLTAFYVYDPAKAALQQGPAQFAMFSAALGLVLLAGIPAGRQTALAMALVLAEVGSNSTRFYPDKEMGFTNLEKLSAYEDIASFLREQRRLTPFRITVDDSVGLQCFGAWYGIEQVNGCANMSINMFREHWRPELQPLLSARYHLGPSPRLPDQVQRFTGRSGVHVWESPAYAPWTWTAHQLERVSEGQLGDLYRRGWPAVREPLFALDAGPGGAVCRQPDAWRLTDLRPGYGRVEAKMGCDGWVIYSAAKLPGWEATVDGHSVPIVEAYGKLMAVPASAGAHTVEFRFAPRSVWIGAVLTVGGGIALAVWWWLTGRQAWGFPSRRRRVAT